MKTIQTAGRLLCAGSTLLVTTLVSTCAAVNGQGVLPQDALPASPTAAADSTEGPAARPAAPSAGVRIMTVDGADLSELQNLASSNVQAVVLNVSLQTLQSDAASTAALLGWVRDGGTVLLHTDAARVFGYQTVAARASTDAVAGHYFGRARAALPFGISPLLWNNGDAPAARTATAARAKALTDVPAIRTVYYQMAEGDHLVAAHPGGIPLLEVRDSSVRSATPLYAAAIASYGRGWAFFSPWLVEQHRGDGAAFVRGLLRLITVSPRTAGVSPGAPATATAAPEVWISFPADLIVSASAATAGGRFDPAAYVRPFSLAVFGAAIDEDDASPQSTPDGPGADTQAEAEVAEGEVDEQPVGLPARPVVATAGLLMTRREADATARLLDRARTDSVSRARVITAIYLLRMRLELQRDNAEGAQTWLAAANRIAGGAAESLLWRGVFAVQEAEDIGNTSPQRATRWREAAASWRSALTAPSLLATGVQPARVSISGVPRTFLQAWVSGAVAAANRVALAPPLQEIVGTEESGVTLHHNGDRQLLNYILPSLKAFDEVSRVLGWRADREEILVFPNLDAYAAYRASAGLVAQNLAFSFRTPSALNELYRQRGESLQNDLDGVEPNLNGMPLLADRDTVPENGLPGDQTAPEARTPATLPYANLGEVLDGQVLTVAPLSVVPPRFTGNNRSGPRLLLSTDYLVPLGNLHARVLVQSLAQGGTPLPSWLQLGLNMMGERELLAQLNPVMRRRNPDAYLDSPRFSLPGAQSQGLLLGPQQFQRVPVDGSATVLMNEQALSLVLYFYRQFGAGRVVETLQRLGAAQPVDVALMATTGLTEEAFFAAWAAATLPDRPSALRNRR